MSFTDYYFNLGYQSTLEKVAAKKKKDEGMGWGAKLGLGALGAAGLGAGAYFGGDALKGVGLDTAGDWWNAKRDIVSDAAKRLFSSAPEDVSKGLGVTDPSNAPDPDVSFDIGDITGQKGEMLRMNPTEIPYQSPEMAAIAAKKALANNIMTEQSAGAGAPLSNMYDVADKIVGQKGDMIPMRPTEIPYPSPEMAAIAAKKALASNIMTEQSAGAGAPLGLSDAINKIVGQKGDIIPKSPAEGPGILDSIGDSLSNSADYIGDKGKALVDYFQRMQAKYGPSTGPQHTGGMSNMGAGLTQPMRGFVGTP